MGGERVYSTEEFNKALHEQHEIERTQFLRTPLEQRVPKLIIMTRVKGKDDKLENQIIVCAIASGFEDAETKHKMMIGLGAKIAEQGIRFPVAVYLHSEVWISSSDKEKIESGTYTPASEDPNHSEALMTTGMTIDGRVNMAQSAIKTKAENKVRFLMEPLYMDYSVKNKDMEWESTLLKEFWKGYSMYLFQKGELFKNDQAN